MSKTRYGISPWLDRIPKSRRPVFPAARGSIDVDVVIVGGGFTGCAIAYALAGRSRRVALVEAGQLGVSGCGTGSGLVLPLVGSASGAFLVIRERAGLRVARDAFALARRSVLDLAAAMRRLRVRCDAVSRSTLEVLSAAGFVRPSGQAVKRLRREHDARREAGLEVAWITPAKLVRDYKLTGGGAIRTPAGLHLDPYRACLGLAKAAASQGVAIFERSPAVRVGWTRREAELRTDRAVFRARAVMVATGMPEGPWRGLARHFKRRTAYAVVTPPLGVPLLRAFGRGDAIVCDTDEPPHRLGFTRDGRVVFAGADQDPVPPRARDRTLVQRTAQLMYELSRLYPPISGLQPDAGWETTYAVSIDGVPFIGPHRNYPHHLFALGMGSGGLGLGFLAGRILRGYLTGDVVRAWKAFDFTRLAE